MKKSFRRTAAFVLALTLVAGTMPANVGGFLTGGTAIVARADGNPQNSIVITSENFSDYFETNGYLKDSVAVGSTLDFKGTFYGPNYTVHINKQVNITSSDNTAVFDSRPSETGTVDTDNLLNFQFETGADNSTVRNLKFRNCWLHIKGSEHLTFDSIDVFVNERIGTGKGFISIYGGANFATIKNSNIECPGNGGSSCIAVRAGAKDVTFENNIIKTSGNVGNVFAVTPYNTDGYSGSQDHITFKNNTIINGNGGAISNAIQLQTGKDHVVEGNNIYCSSYAISAGTEGSTVKNNTITGGGAISIGKDGIAEGNVTSGGLYVNGEGAKAKNNTMHGVNKTMTISGASAEVSGNTVKGNVSISGQGAVFTDNNVTGTVTVGRSSKGNTITGNTIVSSGEYAVVLSSTAADSNTTVTGNTLIAAEKGGDDAVKPGTGGGNTINNNKDYLTVTEDKPLVVKEGSKFTVNDSVTISGSGSNAQVTAGTVFEVSKTQEGNWLVKYGNSEAYNKPVSAEIPTGTLLVSISGGTLTFTENQVYTNKTINASDIKQGDVLAVATKVTANSENMFYQKANGDYQEYTSSPVEIGLTGLMNSSTLEVPFANADKNAFIYTEKKDGKCYFDQTYAYFHGNITAENGITVTKGEDTLEDGARNNVEGEVVFTSDNFFVVTSGTAKIPATLDTSATTPKYKVTHTMAGDVNAVIAAVEVKTGSTYTYFKTLEEAIESANAESGSSTITLKDNVETTSSNITIPSGKSLTLYLQGKACTGNAVLINNGSLTIRDGSTEGTGTFSLSINNNKTLGLYNATFTKGIVTLGDDNPQTVVSSGHIHSVSIDKECNGILYISGGKIDSVNIDEGCSGTLTLRGGVFKEKPDGNLYSTSYKLVKLAANQDGYSYGVFNLNNNSFTIANVSPKDYDGESGVELSVTPPTSTSQLQIEGYNIEYTYQWAKKDGENFTDISGATGATYTTGANVADSGTYQCTVMSGDTVVKTLTKDVTINKAANPATVTNTATVMRGGNTVDLSSNVALNDATGTVSYEFSGDANGCTLAGSVLTSGTSTGTVIVNVTVATDNNYEALAATPITVTISDKNTQTITANNVTATYGNTNKSVSASTSGDGAISYAVKNGSEEYISVDATTGALTINKVPTNGVAYVIVTAAETQTYAQAIKEVTITINKASALKTVPTAKNPTHYSSAVELVNAGTTATAECKMYYLVADTKPEANATGWSTAIPTANAQGTYKVWYKVTVTGNDNYADTAVCDTPVTVTVTQYTALTPTYSSQTWTLTMESYEYDGTAHVPTINGKMYGDVKYTYYNADTNEKLSAAPSEVGKYKVIVFADGGSEYYSRNQTATYSITDNTAANLEKVKEAVAFTYDKPSAKLLNGIRIAANATASANNNEMRIVRSGMVYWNTSNTPKYGLNLTNAEKYADVKTLKESTTNSIGTNFLDKGYGVRIRAYAVVSYKGKEYTVYANSRYYTFKALSKSAVSDAVSFSFTKPTTKIANGNRVLARTTAKVSDDSVKIVKTGLIYWNDSEKPKYALDLTNVSKYEKVKKISEADGATKSGSFLDKGYGVTIRGYAVISYEGQEYVVYSPTRYYRYDRLAK